MSDALLASASERRLELTAQAEQDQALGVLLANYQRVTADPRKMGYLRFLLKHYAKDPHPWRACYKDNFKRFGPKTKGLCGVLKDTIRQRTDWRGHDNPNDAGSPGVGIAEADAPAAPAWGGHGPNLKLSVLDVPDDVWAALEDLTRQCDPCRVLLGLDPAPQPSTDYLADLKREATLIS